MLYDAKILKTFDPITQKIDTYDEKKKEHIISSPNKKFPQKFLTEVCYMVHYQGWNSKWDEWVLPSRILEINNENIMLKENLVFELQEQERLKREALEAEEKRKEDEKLAEKLKDKKKTSLTIKLPMKTNKDQEKSKNASNGNKKNLGISSIINGNGNKNNNSNNDNNKRKLSNGDKDDVSENNRKSKKIDSKTLSGFELKIKRKSINNNNNSGSNSTNSIEGGHYESKNGFTHHEIQSLIPDSLKIILVDDWENITKNNKLVTLKEKYSVSQTLDDFIIFLNENFNEEKDDLDIFFEITNSLKLYFEQCLGTFLLYRYERPQYSDVLNDEEISHLYDIYPTIFLLRLFSIFPSILIMNNVDPVTIRTSKVYLDIILFWLEQNKEKYFIQNYENQCPWVALMHG